MLDVILSSAASHWPLILLITFLSWLLWNYTKTPQNLPPGPRGLPILGFQPFMGDKPHETFAKLQKEYGDLFLIYLGPYPTIILNSFDMIKTALVKQADVFSSRPIDMIPSQFKNTRGIVFNTGEQWSDFRRFSLSTLRDFGFGKSSLEPRIRDEIDNFIEQLKTTKGQPTDISDLLRMSITNIVCTLITGQRYEYDDPIFVRLVKNSEEQIDGFGFQNIEQILPDFLRIPSLMKILGIRSYIAPTIEMADMMAEIIKRHEKNHTPGSHDNFIDAWLTEMKRDQKRQEIFNADQLPIVLSDLFVAGSDTTSNTIRWGLLYMMKYPEIQKKIQREIDEVIGQERTPSMIDQKDMPFTEATLMEIARSATILPLSLPHCAERDTTLNGYSIPKKTMVFVNLWAVHHDPKSFPEPHEFKPERFLSGNQIKKMEQLVPFSMGKRQCLGESLARMELFLYFTSILQHFTITKVEGSEVLFDHISSFISVPKPYKLCAVPR